MVLRRVMGAKVPVSPALAGEGRLPVEVGQSVSGLSSSTLYHYRLVASNGGGTSYGEDKAVTPGYPSEWRINGEKKSSPVKATGTLVLEAPVLGKVTEECVVSEIRQSAVVWHLWVR